MRSLTWFSRTCPHRPPQPLFLLPQPAPILSSRVISAPGSLKVVHGNLHGEQGCQPRAAWALLTTPPPSVLVLVDPTWLLPPTYSLSTTLCLGTIRGAPSHPLFQCMCYKPQITAQPVHSRPQRPFPDPSPTSLDSRMPSLGLHAPAKSSVPLSSFPNVLALSCSDVSPSSPLSPLQWGSLSLSGDIPTMARKGRSRENKDEQTALFFALQVWF